METNPYQDPRWQQRRLEILQRDQWTCQRCGQREHSLQVAHLGYLPDWPPWELPPQQFCTLCRPCHTATVEERRAWQAHYRQRLWALPLLGGALYEPLDGLLAWLEEAGQQGPEYLAFLLHLLGRLRQLPLEPEGEEALMALLEVLALDGARPPEQLTETLESLLSLVEGWTACWQKRQLAEAGIEEIPME
jgi:hypothetical protein